MLQMKSPLDLPIPVQVYQPPDIQEEVIVVQEVYGRVIKFPDEIDEPPLAKIDKPPDAESLLEKMSGEKLMAI